MSLTLAPVTMKKLHDRERNITNRVFWPKNQDITHKQSRILVHKDNTFLEPTLHFKALNTYILPLSRVWPEDWTDLALQCILINYQWLSNCACTGVAPNKLHKPSLLAQHIQRERGGETSLDVERDRGHNVRNNLTLGNQEEQQLLGQGPLCLLNARITTGSDPNSPSPENLQKHLGGIRSVGNKRTRNECI